MKFRIYLLVVVSFLAFSVSTYAQNSNASPQPTDEIKKLVVKRKPHARPYGCSAGTRGEAKVRVTFGKDGKIGDRTLVQSSGCKGFDESAIDAAGRIKFEPQMRNGEAVTVSKLILYSYYIR
jgi:TonB family protein